MAVCRSGKCQFYRNEPPREGCALHPVSICRIETHFLKGGGCLASEPIFGPIERLGWPTNSMTKEENVGDCGIMDVPYSNESVSIEYVSESDDSLDDVLLVTTHFNPSRFKRLAETYKEWLPSLGRLSEKLRCYELVLDDDAPEVEGSFVIRGTRDRHLMWQKEALINQAIADAPSNIKYIGWLDHDLVLENTKWAIEAVKAIKAGAPAVQMFGQVVFLDQDRRIIDQRPASIANSGRGSPGGPWMASVDFMKRIGGLEPHNPMGGGDRAFELPMGGRTHGYVDQYSPDYKIVLLSYMDRVTKERGDCLAGHVSGRAYHLWHGSRHDRQYIAREAVLADFGFVPSDIRVNEDGIMEWVARKPGLRREVAKYFQRRNEDATSTIKDRTWLSV